MSRQLQLDFAADLAAGMAESLSVGAHTQRISEMIKRYGAQGAAERLILSGDIQTGLLHLANAQRLDISVEGIMLKDKYKELFKPAVLEAAQFRYDEAKRSAKK